MGLPTTVRLTPGRWIRLPGTGVEVYLMGKYQGEGPVEFVYLSQDERTQTEYWDLTYIYHRLYVRGVDIYGHPTTLAEAVRPPVTQRSEQDAPQAKASAAVLPGSGSVEVERTVEPGGVLAEVLMLTVAGQLSSMRCRPHLR